MSRLASTKLEDVYERILVRAIAAIPEANDANCFIGEQGDMPDVPDEWAFVIIPSPAIPFTEKQEGGGAQTAEVTTTFTVAIHSSAQNDAIGRAAERFRNATRGLWPQFVEVCKAFLDHDLQDASGDEMLSESIHAGSGNSVSFDRSFSSLSVVFEMTFDLDLL